MHNCAKMYAEVFIVTLFTIEKMCTKPLASVNYTIAFQAAIGKILIVLHNVRETVRCVFQLYTHHKCTHTTMHTDLYFADAHVCVWGGE